MQRRQRPPGMYVVIAIPIVLALTFAWQVGSSLLHTEVLVRQAVAVGQLTLEPDAAGTRVDIVLVDKVGQETTASGSVKLSLKEPDGSVWQTTRTISDSDFHPLPDGSLLAGRNGLSVVIPASDWARPPRRGGLAVVSITVTMDDDSPPFGTVISQIFP